MGYSETLGFLWRLQRGILAPAAAPPTSRLRLATGVVQSIAGTLKGMLDIPHEKPGEETKKTAKVFLLPTAKVLEGPTVGFSSAPDAISKRPAGAQ